MTEQEALAKMIAPAGHRPSKPYLGGVIQICVTSICDLACFHCTQASQLETGDRGTMTPEQFEQAVDSLAGYWGVLGVFGGNPATSKHFVEYCNILQRKWPKERAGLWCNNIINIEKATAARAAFNPQVSNLNCHLSKTAYANFKRWWPESMPFGLDKDSRHSPPFVAMRDVLKKPCPRCADQGYSGTTAEGQDCTMCKGEGKAYDEERAWELISGCDINQNWSAMICLFRGQLRAFFCEIAGAQAMLHQGEADYPDTGFKLTGGDGLPGDCDVPFGAPHACLNVGTFRGKWWQLPMIYFQDQVRKHCHECSVPLRGYGELSQSDKGCEQTSVTHARVYSPKRRNRPVQVVERLEQLGTGRLATGAVTKYLQNAV